MHNAALRGSASRCSDGNHWRSLQCRCSSLAFQAVSQRTRWNALTMGDYAPIGLVNLRSSTEVADVIRRHLPPNNVAAWTSLVSAEHGGCIEESIFSQALLWVLSIVTTVSSSRYSYCASGVRNGWFVFNTQSDLQSDSAWCSYFQTMYGQVPSDRYPICVYAFFMIYHGVASSSGLSLSAMDSCPSSDGDFFNQMCLLSKSTYDWIYDSRHIRRYGGVVCHRTTGWKSYTQLSSMTTVQRGCTIRQDLPYGSGQAPPRFIKVTQMLCSIS